MPERLPPLWRAATAAGLMLTVFALNYRLGTPALFDDPNDAQYAEVAREMWEGGDWISPRLNYVVFLNKPPLLYWLIAGSYALFGVSEWAARLPGALVTLASLFLLYRLGRELFDPLAGLLAAAVCAGMPSTLIEARFIRPDSLLTAAIIGTLLAFCVAGRTDGARRRRALYCMQGALAVGLLAKGIVGLLLPGVPIAVVILLERRWDLLRTLAAPRTWWVFAALVAPWHVAAALRHPGFTWDYVVNQHLLFFLDKKEPRDSIPITLRAFWGAFILRTFPWTLFVPPALIAGIWARRASQWRRAYGLVLAWAGGTLFFFSAATSRLEHYALPAVPAVALAIGALLRQWTEWGRTRYWLGLLPLLVSGLVFGAGIWLVPQLLADVAWLREADELGQLARVFFAALTTVCAVSTVALRRAPLAAGPLLGGAVLAMTPLIHTGLVAIAPVNSSAPVAEVLRRQAAFEGANIVFEAPIEYQNCAGLNFYVRRKIALLEPSGFVDPPYLAPHHNELFINRAQLAALWTNTPILFVSDPLAAASRPLGEVVPEPFFPLARTANRWIVSNHLAR